MISVDRLLQDRKGTQGPFQVRVGRAVSLQSPVRDRLARPLTDLRLSVTDRCNFRCTYCMPRTKVSTMVEPTSRARLLNFDELTEVAAAFVALGVKKLRVTGGEPLVRRDLASLIARLARLDVRDVCLTTNGSLLAAQAQALSSAGLSRATVSLDAMDEPTFRRMTDSQATLSSVLDGIDAARKVGLNPVKINMVVQRGVNDHCVIPMAAWARRERLELRYIEYMDVGCTNGWRRSEVLTEQEIRARVHSVWPIEACEPDAPHGTAQRFRYTDGGGEIGIIASITKPFCGDCSRARVSSVGEFYPCLFATMGADLASPLRNGEDLRPIIASLWQGRNDRYSELRAVLPSSRPRPEMSAIGG